MKMPRPVDMSVKPRSEPQTENAPHYSTGNNDGFVRPEREFLDHDYWLEMFSTRLGRYPVPTGPCSVVEMERWLDRLGLETKDHENIFNTSPQDFMIMNPEWPLFAWLGIVLEQTQEIKP